MIQQRYNLKNASLFLLIIMSLMIFGCKENENSPGITSPKKIQVLSSQSNVIFSSLFFINSASGYAVGSAIDDEGLYLNGLICKTTDEGLTWKVISPDTLADLTTVFFTDTLTGYAAGTNSIIKTINGGEDWFTIFYNPQIHIHSICFPDKNTGFAVGLFGEILKTINAGESWEYLESGTRCHLISVCFTDNLTGYSVGFWNQDPDLYGIMIKTMNGGMTWDSIPLPAGYTPSSITFTRSSVGYISGGNSVLKTTDEGRNWDIIYSYPGGSLNTASFIKNSPSGIVVGQNGVIFKTVDAGVSWSQISNPTNSLMTSVLFVNHDLAYFTAFDPVTKTGSILKWK